MSKKQEHIYISWHYTTHGIAFLQNILAAFYRNRCSVQDRIISAGLRQSPKQKEYGLDQIAMHNSFDHKGHFLFDKVYYLYAEQKVTDQVSERRHKYRKELLRDELIDREGLRDLAQALIKQRNISIQEDFDFLEQRFPQQAETYKKLIWRDIHHYPVTEQIKWFTQHSNAASRYAERFESAEMPVDELRDVKKVTDALRQFMQRMERRHPDAHFYIFVNLGSTEINIAWHVLSEVGKLPRRSRLLQAYDYKDYPSYDAELRPKGKRFKPFFIREVPQKIVEEVQKDLLLFSHTISPKRQLAQELFDHYINQGLAILLMGERGIGKTRLMEVHRSEDNFASLNCASLEDDSKAESELFGHAKGAFTGANKTKLGLFHDARNGYLFFDEIHALSKRVQAKLMTALQTDENNNFHFRRLGSSKKEKSKFRAIFASNKSLKELRECLLPDFYDRIAQLVIEIPPLRETPEDRLRDWEAIWKQMRFEESYACPQEPALQRWLKAQPLYGNYRDLQKIAIYYKTFLDLAPALRKKLPHPDALSFTQTQFERFHGHPVHQGQAFYQADLSIKQQEKLLKKRLAAAAERHWGDLEEVVRREKELGSSISKKTLQNWKRE